MAERPIDHGWEALVEVTNANVAQERGALNRALSVIRDTETRSDYRPSGEELALMIRHRANLYREVFPTMPLTASALAKWWGKLEEEAERLRKLAAEEAAKLEERRKRGTNLRTESHCITCKGNSWVVVGHRKPVQSAWMREHGIEVPSHPDERGHEETAPCPVCNADSPVMRGYWNNRSWTYSSVPGEVTLT
jgi:hypothetical protein